MCKVYRLQGVRKRTYRAKTDTGAKGRTRSPKSTSDAAGTRDMMWETQPTNTAAARPLPLRPMVDRSGHARGDTVAPRHRCAAPTCERKGGRW